MRFAVLLVLLALPACYLTPGEIARTPTSITLRYDPGIGLLTAQEQDMVETATKHCRQSGFVARQATDTSVAFGLRQRRYECVRGPRPR